MTAEEVVSWKGYLRQRPRGFEWDNMVLAALSRQIHATVPREKGYRMPDFEKFQWQPPEPMFVRRLRNEGRRKRESKERKAQLRKEARRNRKPKEGQ
jgi:hypothetical protein